MTRIPKLEQQALEGMGTMLVYEAQSIWQEAGCPDDFCVQHANLDVVVFGSVNRVVWSIVFGFKADRAYCTEKFLAGFARWKHLKGL